MKKKAAGRTKNQFGKNEVRKRAAVMNLTWLVVWLLSFAGMAAFYELMSGGDWRGLSKQSVRGHISHQSYVYGKDKL